MIFKTMRILYIQTNSNMIMKLNKNLDTNFTKDEIFLLARMISCYYFPMQTFIHKVETFFENYYIIYYTFSLDSF